MMNSEFMKTNQELVDEVVVYQLKQLYKNTTNSALMVAIDYTVQAYLDKADYFAWTINRGLIL